MNPRYPIYVISKGRWESRLTAKALDLRGIPFHVVIEPQEYDQYAAVIDPQKIYVLPFRDLGQGSIPARNWCWEHSLGIGAERHWILDDNIRSFMRFHQNRKWRTIDGTSFAIIEDFVNRYENVVLAGMQYAMFFPTKKHHRERPVRFNTRIYSCILIDNQTPFRWRGRYNEDTDLSLRCLKAGYCTALFYAFLCEKVATMTMKGGNTDELYQQGEKQDGRLLMAQSLQQQHPDVVRISRKWGRWQHQVDYRPFKKNKLVRRAGIEIPNETNEYGMVLRYPSESGVRV